MSVKTSLTVVRRWRLIVSVIFVLISDSAGSNGDKMKIGLVSDVTSTQFRIDVMHEAIERAQSEGFLTGYNIRYLC